MLDSLLLGGPAGRLSRHFLIAASHGNPKIMASLLSLASSYTHPKQQQCTSAAVPLSRAALSSYSPSRRSKVVQPSSKIDWPNLKFGLAPTNGYVKYTWVRTSCTDMIFGRERSCEIRHGFRRREALGESRKL